MADGTAHEGSAGRVLTRSLLVRWEWEGERRVSTYLCAPCFLFLTSSSSFPAARSFLSSHSSCSFRPSHVLCRMRRACRSEHVMGKHVAGEKKTSEKSKARKEKTEKDGDGEGVKYGDGEEKAG